MRTFLKYSNRKLYDTESSEYVKLEDIVQAVLEGMEVEVLEKNTGQDVTTQVLIRAFSQMPHGHIISLKTVVNLIKTAGSV